jgi:hypothetical protein
MVVVSKTKKIEDESFLEIFTFDLKNRYFGKFTKIEQIQLRIPL